MMESSPSRQPVTDARRVTISQTPHGVNPYVSRGWAHLVATQNWFAPRRSNGTDDGSSVGSATTADSAIPHTTRGKQPAADDPTLESSATIASVVRGVANMVPGDDNSTVYTTESTPAHGQPAAHGPTTTVDDATIDDSTDKGSNTPSDDGDAQDPMDEDTSQVHAPTTEVTEFPYVTLFRVRIRMGQFDPEQGPFLAFREHIRNLFL